MCACIDTYIGHILRCLLCLVGKETVFLRTDIYALDQIRFKPCRCIACQAPYWATIRTEICHDAIFGKSDFWLLHGRLCTAKGRGTTRKRCGRSSKCTRACASLHGMFIPAVVPESTATLQKKLAHDHLDTTSSRRSDGRACMNAGNSVVSSTADKQHQICPFLSSPLLVQLFFKNEALNVEATNPLSCQIASMHIHTHPSNHDVSELLSMERIDALNPPIV